MSGREKRFMRDVNHCASKRLANDTSVSVYVVERLKGVRNKKRGRKVNGWVSNWSYSDFEEFLRYKCRMNGIGVADVDPRHTSQKCCVCGNIDKDARQGSRYICSACGMREHADVNAARNIRDNYVRSKKPEQGAFNHPYVYNPEPQGSV